ncbi:MAG: TolC family protein [Bacteroidales bacterium]|nr:TolC family protein [Bacteroidales bacterium]
MIRLKNLTYIVASLFAFTSANGQGDELSLSLALDKALENNYGVIISRADQEIADINNNWGNAGRYPTIGFDASDNNSYDLTGSTYTNRLSAGVGLNWTLFDGFRVGITKSKLENMEDLSSGRLAVLIENTVEDILLGYYNVLLQQEQLEVLKTVMELSSDRYQYELKRQSLGGSVTYNVLQAQNVYLTDKANFMSQEVVIRNSIRNLNFMMGVDPAKTWNFDEPFEAETTSYLLQDLLSKLKSSNQTLKNQYTNLLLQQDETSLREASYYPTMSVGTGMDYSHTWTHSSGAPTVGTQAVSPYGNIRLSYNIYSAGVRKRAVEVARINEEVAQVEISQMEHALTNELFNLFDYYEVRVELLNVADENLEAALLNLSISEDKYRSGVINSFNYRDIQLIYLSAALRRLQAIYNLIDSKTQLTRITGGFLGSAESEGP